jgi:hypothetical protein
VEAKRKAATRRVKRRDWSATEVRQLRALAGRKSLRQIAKALGRTVMATRRKATTQGISLAMKG